MTAQCRVLLICVYEESRREELHGKKKKHKLTIPAETQKGQAEIQNSVNPPSGQAIRWKINI